MIISQSETTVNSKFIQLYTDADLRRRNRDNIHVMPKDLEIDGARLESLMSDRNLRASTLAYKTGISKQMILKIINGGRPNASAVLLGKLARELQCSLDYLVGLTDIPLPYGMRGTDEEMQQMMVTLAGLSLGRQRDLLRIADTLRQTDLQEQEALVRRLRAMKWMLQYIEDKWGLEAKRQWLDVLGGPVGLSATDLEDRLSLDFDNGIDDDNLAGLFGDEPPDDVDQGEH